MRVRGYFPVALYADANLPYFIDEPAPLRTMRDGRELTLVDAGTVADEVLLRTAKHLQAPLVTNDKMEDWDPDGEVTENPLHDLAGRRSPFSCPLMLDFMTLEEQFSRLIQILQLIEREPFTWDAAGSGKEV